MIVNFYSSGFALGPHAECSEHRAKTILRPLFYLLVCQFDRLGKVEETGRAFAELDRKIYFFFVNVVDVIFLDSHLGRIIFLPNF